MTATQGLFDEGSGVGGPEGADGVEVGDVPTFLEHIHVDDDFGGLVGILDGQ